MERPLALTDLSALMEWAPPCPPRWHAGARVCPHELTASLLGSMTDFQVLFGPEGAQTFQVQKTLSLRTQTWVLKNSHPITLAYSSLLPE